MSQDLEQKIIVVYIIKMGIFDSKSSRFLDNDISQVVIALYMHIKLFNL